MRLQRLLPLLAVLSTIAIAGCAQTVTQQELDDALAGTQGNSFPGQLIHERRTPHYDYYRIEDQLGTYGRYRVRRGGHDEKNTD